MVGSKHIHTWSVNYHGQKTLTAQDLLGNGNYVCWNGVEPSRPGPVDSQAIRLQ